MTNPSSVIACNNVLPENCVGALTELLARTFSSGDADIIVAMDAIGLGLKDRDAFSAVVFRLRAFPLHACWKHGLVGF